MDPYKSVYGINFDAATELQALAAIRKVIKWTKPEFAKVVKSLKRSSSSRRWVDAIPTFENGEPKPLMISATIGLEFDDEWRDVIWFNEFTGMIWFRRRPPYEEAAGEECDRAWTDDDELATTHWMQEAGLTTPRNVVFEAVAHAAAQNKFHPARDYFDSLEWDEVERLKKPSRYFGEYPMDAGARGRWRAHDQRMGLHRQVRAGLEGDAGNRARLLGSWQGARDGHCATGFAGLEAADRGAYRGSRNPVRGESLGRVFVLGRG